MFIRFITQFKNDQHKIETGVFQAARFLSLSNQTFNYDKERLEKIRKWFDDNLERPDKFSNSNSKNPPKVSLSWYKSSAIEHLKWMYEMKEVLERYDMHVEVIKRENPGYIIYEDEHQISTIPHRADKNKVR